LAKYYDDGINELCVACDYTCKTCTGSASNLCTNCDAAKYRITDTAGGCKCLDGYHNDGSNEICLPCHYSCELCSAAGSTACT